MIRFTVRHLQYENYLFSSGDDEAQECPNWNSSDIQVKTLRSDSVKADYIAEATCKPLGSYFELLNDLKRYHVYPDPKKTCRSNGTWTSPYQMCLDRETNLSCKNKVIDFNLQCIVNASVFSIKAEQVLVRPLRNETKSMVGPHFTNVGRLHKNCRQISDAVNPRTFIISFTFDGPHFFSFVTIQAPPGKSEWSLKQKL